MSNEQKLTPHEAVLAASIFYAERLSELPLSWTQAKERAIGLLRYDLETPAWVRSALSGADGEKPCQQETKPECPRCKSNGAVNRITIDFCSYSHRCMASDGGCGLGFTPMTEAERTGFGNEDQERSLAQNRHIASLERELAAERETSRTNLALGPFIIEAEYAGGYCNDWHDYCMKEKSRVDKAEAALAATIDRHRQSARALLAAEAERDSLRAKLEEAEKALSESEEDRRESRAIRCRVITERDAALARVKELEAIGAVAKDGCSQCQQERNEQRTRADAAESESAALREKMERARKELEPTTTVPSAAAFKYQPPSV